MPLSIKLIKTVNKENVHIFSLTSFISFLKMNIVLVSLILHGDSLVKTVIRIFEREDIVGHVNKVAPYLTKRLDELVEEMDCVTERKGKGLMQGIVVTKPLAEVNRRAIEEGLLIIQAEGNVFRFVPPLIVEEKHIDEMIVKLKRALS